MQKKLKMKNKNGESTQRIGPQAEHSGRTPEKKKLLLKASLY